MQIVKLTIRLDAKLVDALSDFLIGVHDAAIESRVTEEGGPSVLHAFVEKELRSPDEAEALADTLKLYGQELAEIFLCAPPDITVEILEDRDWSESWKVYFKPFAIVPGLVIVPTWEKYEPAPDEQVIVMDPGMAFGTGHHETTRLCLQFLNESEIISSGGNILDVGTGTGILAMAAVRFGARQAVGIDTDPEAVKAARDNCRLNGLSRQIEISAKDIAAIDATFDLVVANIVHDVLLELSVDLARVAGAGSLLLSGLIDGNQSETIINCFEEKNFRMVDKRVDGQWCALLFEKAG